jgi:hypothetical protein
MTTGSFPRPLQAAKFGGESPQLTHLMRFPLLRCLHEQYHAAAAAAGFAETAGWSTATKSMMASRARAKPAPTALRTVEARHIYFVQAHHILLCSLYPLALQFFSESGGLGARHCRALRCQPLSLLSSVTLTCGFKYGLRTHLSNEYEDRSDGHLRRPERQASGRQVRIVHAQ